MQKLNKKLQAQIDKLAVAQQRLVEITAEVQSKCLHERVAETPWTPLNYAGCLNAIRICLCCGYEEEGSHWSGGHVWSEANYNKAVLGNRDGRDILTVEDRDTFYRLRLPR